MNQPADRDTINYNTDTSNNSLKQEGETGFKLRFEYVIGPPLGGNCTEYTEVLKFIL